MTFISYAQNFEDVMLWRALKHIEHGFYVDVGAQHPIVDSVSKAFYEHGWRGIHIEPVPTYVELLRADRSDETVIQAALSDKEGTLELNIIPNTGLSTAVDTYAEDYQVRLGFKSQRVVVPVLTLQSALCEWQGKDLHWLKIDVEGFEENVLKGWDSKVLRPWVMVIEATIPGSPEPDYKTWEPLVLNAGYRFAYFDGLNRFYVADEHAELMGSFSCPPNVFDEVRLSGLASSELCRGIKVQYERLMSELEEQLKVAQESVVAQTARAAQAEADFDSILMSRSWRLTAPLRSGGHVGRSVLRSGPVGKIRDFAKRMSRSFTYWVAGKPRIRAMVVKILDKMPYVKSRLRSAVYGIGNDGVTGHVLNKYGQELSCRAMHIYNELQQTIRAKNAGDK